MRSLLVVLLLNAPVVLAADNAVAPQTGRFKISSPIAELTDAQTRLTLQKVVSADSEIEWEIYVPQNYSATEPAGIMVYISPTNSGRIPRRWKALMDRHNLIWIGANRSGNQVMTMRRMLFSALAPEYIKKHYAVNHDRIYVSGFSGGGRVSSLTAIEFAGQFKGAIFICGVNPPREEHPVLLDQIRQNRFVFLTGSKDFNEAETRQVYKTYRELGVHNSKLMVVPHMTHRNPDADEFAEAIRFLDGGAQDSPVVDHLPRSGTGL